MRHSDHQICLKSSFCDGAIISGISGRFPKSANMSKFQRNLFDCVDLTTEAEEKWKHDGGPERFGFLESVDKFNANFFNLTSRQAQQLDPQTTLLMEATFEAIVDSGNEVLHLLSYSFNLTHYYL